ncbi:MAG TPA: hypothetical protein VNR00_02425, partial [Opitutus sp.]|nr:hypothetical protein [Opitutus sp.]
LRAKNPGRKRTFLLLLVAAVLLSALGYAQVRNDFLGWLYPSVWMRRITSLDESRAFATAFDWIAQASFVEIALLTAPIVGASAALALGWRRRSSSAEITRRQLISATVIFAGVLLLALFRVRWGVVATLLAWPLVAGIVRDAPVYRRIAATAAGLFLLTLALWSRSLPATLARPGVDTEPSAADVEALLYRHFSHWLASHTPGEKIAALAPPELSDSIVFHGGGHVLMSTAWESYPGQLAARRILSSLESTEAEAVLQGHEITHLILPSWDKVLPLFVQKPLEPGRDTLFDRLDRWTYPGYLRPIPYRLPPAPVYVGQKLAVFKVTPLQDEPLMLSRLAEYFVEMERPEPAAMVARVLMKAYRDDPNAAIARAFVGADARQTTDFERELARLARDVRDGRTPPLWDRRVQRAIALALGRQRELARTEIEACLDTATAADLLELTPLQAYRLSTLAHAYGLHFADENLTSLLAALGAEYRPAEPKGDSR